MELLRGGGPVLRIGHRGVEDGVDVVELDVIGGLLVAHSPADASSAPSLDDELERLAARGLAVQLDVKEAGLGAGVAAALSRHGLKERSFVSTPSRSILREFAAVAPALPRSLSYPADRLGLSGRAAAAPLVRAALAAGRLALPARLPHLLRSVGASAATLDHRVVSRRAIEVCHRLGIAVIAWTVNEPVLATSLVESGIDAIITDVPPIVPARPSTT
ncbi:MAG TPA: glycerophosphodiester phosphodiesterase [Gaiellaceae bacterium]|jgi:glycerophosphoryl diester phosphodiesterase